MACMQFWVRLCVSWSRADGGLIWCHGRAQCTNYSHLCLRAWGTSNCAKEKGDCVILGGKKGDLLFPFSLPPHKQQGSSCSTIFFSSLTVNAELRLHAGATESPPQCLVCMLSHSRITAFFALNLKPFGGLCNSSTKSQINASHCLFLHLKHEGNVLEHTHNRQGDHSKTTIQLSVV